LNPGRDGVIVELKSEEVRFCSGDRILVWERKLSDIGRRSRKFLVLESLTVDMRVQRGDETNDES
jgi:hypothetical protein